MSGQIRAMAATDIDAVRAIADSLHTAPHWERAAYEAAIAPDGVPPRVALVSEIDGRVVGFAVLLVVPPQAEMETIAVMETHQRRGVARALLAAVLRDLALRGVGDVTLEVRASNVAAQAFYRAHSFTEFARRPSYYGDSGEAAILMRAHISNFEKGE